MTDDKDLAMTHRPGVHAFNAFQPHSYTLKFQDEAGKYATIQIKHGVVSYSGELPIDEAAKLFFEHTLMQWRNLARDEDYDKARLVAANAGFSDSDNLVTVLEHVIEDRRSARIFLETIRYEAKQENSERMQLILKYAEQALGLRR